MWPFTFLASLTAVGLLLQIATGLPILEFVFFLGLFLIFRIGIILFLFAFIFLPFWLIPVVAWIGYQLLWRRKTKSSKESTMSKSTATRQSIPSSDVKPDS